MAEDDLVDLAFAQGALRGLDAVARALEDTEPCEPLRARGIPVQRASAA
jgi:hypothetical protein